MPRVINHLNFLLSAPVNLGKNYRLYLKQKIMLPRFIIILTQQFRTQKKESKIKTNKLNTLFPRYERAGNLLNLTQVLFSPDLFLPLIFFPSFSSTLSSLF